jgi:hypothetical protein
MADEKAVSGTTAQRAAQMVGEFLRRDDDDDDAPSVDDDGVKLGGGDGDLDGVLDEDNSLDDFAGRGLPDTAGGADVTGTSGNVLGQADGGSLLAGMMGTDSLRSGLAQSGLGSMMSGGDGVSERLAAGTSTADDVVRMQLGIDGTDTPTPTGASLSAWEASMRDGTDTGGNPLGGTPDGSDPGTSTSAEEQQNLGSTGTAEEQQNNAGTDTAEQQHNVGSTGTAEEQQNTGSTGTAEEQQNNTGSTSAGQQQEGEDPAETPESSTTTDTVPASGEDDTAAGGDNQGGVDTGSGGVDTDYHVPASIRESGGSAPMGFDLAAHHKAGDPDGESAGHREMAQVSMRGEMHVSAGHGGAIDYGEGDGTTEGGFGNQFHGPDASDPLEDLTGGGLGTGGLGGASSRADDDGSTSDDGSADDDLD